MAMVRAIFLTLLVLGYWPANAQNARIAVPNQIDGEVDTYWEAVLSGLIECDTPDICELYRRISEDTYIGSLISAASAKGEEPGPSLGMTTETFYAEFERIMRENAGWLEARIDRAGWFDIKSSGEEADDAAFIIVQHSDYNVPFQRKALGLLKKLAAEKNTNPKNVAYLTDRVARAAGTPQTYGTQGACTGPGKWEPIEIAEPETVDARRASLGLPPLQEYAQSITCH